MSEHKTMVAFYCKVQKFEGRFVESIDARSGRAYYTDDISRAYRYSASATNPPERGDGEFVRVHVKFEEVGP